MEELIHVLSLIYPLNDELRDHLINTVKWRTLTEGEILLRAGDTCENVYFVQSGLLRCYYLDKKDKEVNFWFMKTKDVVYSVRSFLDQTPSTEYIQALEKTTVFYISYQELQKTYQDHITFNIVGRILTENYYKLSVQREEIMRMSDAMDRYSYLVEHFFDLMNAVPDKHLASFIRMSPVHLSRLRNKRSKKAVTSQRN